MINYSKYNGLPNYLYVFFVLLFVFCQFLTAKPVGLSKAKGRAVKWLEINKRAGALSGGIKIKSARTFKDSKGIGLFHHIKLEGSGFVILSADDRLTPVICYSGSDFFDSSSFSPLYDVLKIDIQNRLEMVKRGVGNRHGAWGRVGRNREKWKRLDVFSEGDISVESSSGSGTISEVIVEPFVESKWGQSWVCSSSNDFYNYFTPENYPVGCVATAMSQVMRYFEYPSNGIGAHSFWIEVDGVSQLETTMGGDGAGGAYNWAIMDLDPGCDANDFTRDAIAGLCFDAGLTVSMSYSEGGSSAVTEESADSLKNYYYYADAVKYNNYGNDIESEVLIEMINPNLDAKRPVILGVASSVYNTGHAVVCDGYGYNLGTMYHHLNMGWYGQDDLWYNLPDVDTNSYSFDIVRKCVYNISPDLAGEIVSGRVFDAGGSVLADVTVSASGFGGPFNAVTDSRGVYAFTGLGSGEVYVLDAYKGGYDFGQLTVTTGSSEDYGSCGNVWQADFEALTATPPAAYDVNDFCPPGSAVTVDLNGEDEGLPGMLSYVITELPYSGVITEPNGFVINDVPYTLSSNGKQAVYNSSDCFDRKDVFYYKVDDGGSLPLGGESGEARVVINAVEAAEGLIFYEDFEQIDEWTIIDGYNDGETWTNNPEVHRSSGYLDGEYIIVDSDAAGYGVDVDEELVSKSFDFSDFTGVKVRFNHYLRFYPDNNAEYDEKAELDVKAGAGDWVNVLSYSYTGSTVLEGNVEADISQYADGQSEVRLRWHYYESNYDYYWALDDVEIVGTLAADTVEGDLDMDCSVNSADFALFVSRWLSSDDEAVWNGHFDLKAPQDGFVNIYDYYMMTKDWLWGQ